MKTNKAGSVAPKERINISYKPNDSGAKERIELPMRFMVLSELSKDEEGMPLSDREVIDINQSNFNSVMAKLNVNAKFNVSNKISGDSDEVLDIDLKFESIKDFSPDEIVQKVPELKKLIELRDSLVALKGPIGNLPNLRKAIQNKLEDEKARASLSHEVKKS